MLIIKKLGKLRDKMKKLLLKLKKKVLDLVKKHRARLMDMALGALLMLVLVILL